MKKHDQESTQSPQQGQPRLLNPGVLNNHFGMEGQLPKLLTGPLSPPARDWPRPHPPSISYPRASPLLAGRRDLWPVVAGWAPQRRDTGDRSLSPTGPTGDQAVGCRAEVWGVRRGCKSIIDHIELIIRRPSSLLNLLFQRRAS